MPRTKNHSVSLSTVRAVWRVVSARPHASYREIADELGIGWSTVFKAISHLVQAGYVEQPARKCRTRRVIVPFAEVRL